MKITANVYNCCHNSSYYSTVSALLIYCIHITVGHILPKERLFIWNNSVLGTRWGIYRMFKNVDVLIPLMSMVFNISETRLTTS